MFNRLNEHGRDLGIEVSVAFQARHLAEHPWSPEDYDPTFPHYFSTGLNPRRHTPIDYFTKWSFGADICLDVARGTHDWVLFGPTMTVGNAALSIWPTTTRKLLWSEANLASAQRSTRAVATTKRLLYSRFAALVCPGQRAVDYLVGIAPQLSEKPVLWLPNIVDSALYRERVFERRQYREQIRSRLGVAADELLLLCIGQLVRRKGFSHLIEAVARIEGRYKLFIIGEGNQRRILERRIAELAMESSIRLVGGLPPDGLIDYLAAADWFVHPALSDPSPLVVVEATVAGLPLALSTHTGNAPEALSDNGYSFDASDGRSVGDVLRRILATSDVETQRMGRRSDEIARNRFDPDDVCRRFLTNVLALDV